MWKTIGVSEINYKKLQELKKKLEDQKKVKISINDVITELISVYTC